MRYLSTGNSISLNQRKISVVFIWEGRWQRIKAQRLQIQWFYRVLFVVPSLKINLSECNTGDLWWQVEQHWKCREIYQDLVGHFG